MKEVKKQSIHCRYMSRQWRIHAVQIEIIVDQPPILYSCSDWSANFLL